MDGSKKLDKDGRAIKTYDALDIASISRAWTGFIYSDRRANYEDLDWSTTSYMDPMTMDFRLPSRDLFPKSGLDKSYKHHVMI
jgi:hypothetical protein